MDLGVENAVTLSNGVTIANPRHLKQSLSSLAKLQRKRAKKKRFGANYNKTTKAVQKVFARVSNQKKDFLHKTTSELIKNYGFIATETLSIKNMTSEGGNRKRGLNRGILDVGMGMFLQMLTYKAEEAGTNLIEVPTRTVKPSQTCPCCSRQEKKLLSTRVHQCACGYTASRDVSAATVMLLWAQNKLPTRSGTDPLARTVDYHSSMTQETAPVVSLET